MDNPNQLAPKQQNTLMAVLAYIGPLVIVSYLSAKDVPFVKFHIKQGLVLFSIEVIVWLLGAVMMPLWVVYSIINIAVLVLSVLGIVNVTQGKEAKLPIVGDFAKYFTF